MQRGTLNVFSLMPLMFIYGLGQGTTVRRLTGTALSNVAPENAGGASGVLTTMQQVAASIGVSVLGSIFFTSLGTNHNPDIAHYTRAFTVVLCCNLVLICLTFAQIVRLTRIVPRTQNVSMEHVAMEA
jgi:MFS family permease